MSVTQSLVSIGDHPSFGEEDLTEANALAALSQAGVMVAALVGGRTWPPSPGATPLLLGFRVMEPSTFLAELCAVPAPSGAEDELAALLLERWREPCERVYRDPVGN